MPLVTTSSVLAPVSIDDGTSNFVEELRVAPIPMVLKLCVRAYTTTGHVVYARTHNFSTMAIGASLSSSTKFDVPSSIETGASTLEVVTNGIASKPVSVTI